MHDQAAAPQNQKPLKISVPFLQMLKYGNQSLLSCSAHWSRSAHPHFYLHYTCLKNDIFVICAWEMCSLKDSRAKHLGAKLLGFLIAQLTLLEPRREVCFHSFRIPPGEHHRLHLVCPPWGPVDAQAQLENSHCLNHDWHRTLNFFPPSLCGLWKLPK